MRTLASAFSHLLRHHLPLEALGLWQPNQRLLLLTPLEACKYHESSLVLKGMGTYAATIVRDLWHLHQHLLKDLCADVPDTPHAPDPPTTSPPHHLLPTPQLSSHRPPATAPSDSLSGLPPRRQDHHPRNNK